MASVEFEITIHKGNGGELKKTEDGKLIIPACFDKDGICAWMYRGDGEKSYKEGQKFRYPQDAGKLCQWLVNDIHQIYQIMRYGGKMLWTYENTEFEKVFNEKGKTTEYIRCIDPTNSGIVIEIAKIEKD